MINCKFAWHRTGAVLGMYIALTIGLEGLSRSWNAVPVHQGHQRIAYLNLSSFSFKLMRFLPLVLPCHPLLQRAFSTLENVLTSLTDQSGAQILEVKIELPAKRGEKKPNSKDEKMEREKLPGTELSHMHWMQKQSNMPAKNGMRIRLETS